MINGAVNMPEIFKATLWVKDIKDTTTTVKSDIETKQKDHEQVRTITASNGKTMNPIKLVLSGKPELLEGFTLDEVELRISTDQTQIQIQSFEVLGKKDEEEDD